VDYVKSLGADQVINFEETVHPGSLGGCDVVLDTADGDAYKAAFRVLNPGGTILTIAGMPDAELAAKLGATAVGQMTQVSTAHLERLAQLVASGSLKIYVHRTFPLDKLKDAFLAREAGRVKGKIVLQIKG
jgi:NADPH:quinone reductase-like Zn-dependent oxidoreductase